MVRRLPVLQGPAVEAPWSVLKAAGLAMPVALCLWAVLLWAMRQLGVIGAGLAWVGACALTAAIVGARVPETRRARFGGLATTFTAVLVWAIAHLGGQLGGPWIAALALGAVMGLGGLGFGLGILGLFLRQRGRASLRR